MDSSEYAQEIKGTFLKKKPQDRELPILKELVDRPDIDIISDKVDSVIQTDDILAKQIKLYFRHRYGGLKLKEIGKYFVVLVNQVCLRQACLRQKVIYIQKKNVL